MNENLENPEPTPNLPDNHPEEQPIVPLQQATNHMEVHHHSHAHGKKSWKAYLFEFFMLFLAVFSGFLAEYYLEHRIEKERSNQFIESFYEDLKTDTARISANTNFDQEKLDGLSGLGTCYDAVSENPGNAACLITIFKYSAINRPFIYTERTLRQLANAGGYRLLKKEDADSILFYEKTFSDFADFQATVFQSAQDRVRNTFNNLLNFKANLQMFAPQAGKPITMETFGNPMVTEPILFSKDKALLNQYFNELQLYYRITYNHKRMLLDLKAVQIRLIGYFRNKYHFD